MDDHTVLISCGKMSVLCHKPCWETKGPLCDTLKHTHTHTIEYQLTSGGSNSNNHDVMLIKKQVGTCVFNISVPSYCISRIIIKKTYPAPTDVHNKDLSTWTHSLSLPPYTFFLCPSYGLCSVSFSVTNTHLSIYSLSSLHTYTHSHTHIHTPANRRRASWVTSKLRGAWLQLTLT